MTVRNRINWGWSVRGPAWLQSMLIGCRSRTQSCRRRRAALLAQYRTLTVPAAAAVELLAFWKRNAEQFTILWLTAHRILCISVSWAQSERDFSSVLLLRKCARACHSRK